MLRQIARQPPPREVARAIQRQHQMMAAGPRQVARPRPGRRDDQASAAGIVDGAGGGDDIAGQRADAQLRNELENHGMA